VFGSGAAPGAIFVEFKFVGSVGFVFFGEIILGATLTAKKGDENTRSLF
jgi:hypothetical protein